MPTNLDSITLPGTAVSINKQGILIQGPSGIGKSELALILIQEGHSLIADDAVTLKKNQNYIELHCPEKLNSLLEIRNLGIVNIKDLYGEPAISHSAPLTLIVKLEKSATTPLDRLQGSHSTQTLLGVETPCVSIGCAQERPLAAIVKCALQRLNST